MITIDWSALDFENQVQEMILRFFILRLDSNHPIIKPGEKKIIGLLPGAYEEYRIREANMTGFYLAA